MGNAIFIMSQYDITCTLVHLHRFCVLYSPSSKTSVVFFFMCQIVFPRRILLVTDQQLFDGK